MTRRADLTAPTERETVALAVLAAVEGVGVAELRRRAVTDLAGRALAEPCVAIAVDAIMAARKARREQSVVVPLRRRAAR